MADYASGSSIRPKTCHPQFRYQGRSPFEVRANMPARLHTLVQDPHDFDQVRLDHAVVEDMHRASHLCLHPACQCMSEMEAANPAGQLSAVPGRGSFRFDRDFAHTGGEDRRIATLAFDSPTFDACSKDLRKVSPRQ